MNITMHIIKNIIPINRYINPNIAILSLPLSILAGIQSLYVPKPIVNITKVIIIPKLYFSLAFAREL